jgi:carboxyl-terminal processing protease
MRQKQLFGLSAAGLLLASSLLVTSCKKPDEAMPVAIPTTTTTPTNSTVVTDTEVNNWILANMKVNYYWTDKIPASPNLMLTPDKFFDSILYKFDVTERPDGDRFSWIQQSADELKASLSGETKTDGAQFKLYLRASGSTDVIGKVLYVQRGSPAEKAGLKRGDVFSKVNGTTLTTSNYYDLLFGTTDTRAYGLLKIVNNAFVESADTKTATAVVFQADPVYMGSVYTIGSKKIGYLVYNQFVSSPSGSSSGLYDQKLDNIFAKFKQQGVNELVLDFRYNPGGSLATCVNISSLIGKNITGQTFATLRYNPAVTDAYTKQYGPNFGTYNFTTKSNNIGNSLNRVFVLTTSGTASASEMVINGLRPSMAVTTIGTTTSGKNVGSQTIADQTGRIKWGMQPIMFKIFNSAGQSDYTAGFVPATQVIEYTNVDWQPLGAVSEPLLN